MTVIRKTLVTRGTTAAAHYHRRRSTWDVAPLNYAILSAVRACPRRPLERCRVCRASMYSASDAVRRSAARTSAEGGHPTQGVSVVSGIRPLPCKRPSGSMGHFTLLAVLGLRRNRLSGFTSLCLCVRGAGKSNVTIDEASHTAPWRIIPALRRGFRLLHTLDLRSCRSSCEWCCGAPVGRCLFRG